MQYSDEITDISINTTFNTTLNMFATISKDGYLFLYILPKIKIVRAIKIWINIYNNSHFKILKDKDNIEKTNDEIKNEIKPNNDKQKDNQEKEKNEDEDNKIILANQGININKENNILKKASKNSPQASPSPHVPGKI